jgi:hypothetical protein
MFFKAFQNPKANKLIPKRVPAQQSKNKSTYSKSKKLSQDVPIVMVSEDLEEKNTEAIIAYHSSLNPLIY